MKKDEPEKTKKGLRLSLSFWVRLSSFFAYTSIIKQFLPLQIDPSHKMSKDFFPLPPSNKFK